MPETDNPKPYHTVTPYLVVHDVARLIEFLKHENPIRPWRLDAFSFEQNRALNGFDVAADGAKDRRFAASGRTENDETIGSIDVKADTRGGNELLLAVAVFERYAVDRQ